MYNGFARWPNCKFNAKGNNKLMTSKTENANTHFHATDTANGRTNDISINKTFGNTNNQPTANVSEKPTEKHDFFFTIHTFMTRDLGLRSSALIVYAIIYAFSYDGKGMFYGSFDFLAEKGGIGLTTAKTSVKRLVEDNLISAVSGEKYKHKEYVINRDKIPKQSCLQKDIFLGSRILNAKQSDSDRQNDFSTNGSRILNAEQSDFERTAVGFGIQGSRILNAEQSDFERNNKYNNKLNNNTIINSYNNSAAAQEKEEENNFKENKEIVIRTKEKREKRIKSVPLDVNDHESQHRYLASFIPENASHNGVLGKPYEPSSDTDKSSTSQNPDSFGCENGNDTSQSSEPSICESKSQASQDFAPRSYEKKHYISQSFEPSGYAVKNRYSYASSTAPAQTCKYGNFDPEEAFRAALARTEAWFDELNANKKNED